MSLDFIRSSKRPAATKNVDTAAQFLDLRVLVDAADHTQVVHVAQPPKRSSSP